MLFIYIFFLAYRPSEGLLQGHHFNSPARFGVVYRACAAISRKKPPPKNPRRIPQTWCGLFSRPLGHEPSGQEQRGAPVAAELEGRPLVRAFESSEESLKWAKFKKGKREEECLRLQGRRSLCVQGRPRGWQNDRRKPRRDACDPPVTSLSHVKRIDPSQAPATFHPESWVACRNDVKSHDETRAAQ